MCIFQDYVISFPPFQEFTIKKFVKFAKQKEEEHEKLQSESCIYF